MPNSKHPPRPDDDLYTTVTDEQFDDLMDLTGQQVAQAVLWPDSLAAALQPEAQNPNTEDIDPNHTGSNANTEDNIFDLDLYLKDGVYFELYGVQLYPSLDSEPLEGHAAAQTRLRQLLAGGLWLDDLGVDEEDGLVLILCKRGKPLLYVPAGAWTIDEWDELPDDSDTDTDDSEHDDLSD